MNELNSVAIGFLMYNILAFGLQPMIGYFCDSRPKIPVSLMGWALLATGLLTMPFPWLSLCLCALGNACFHIGGGIDCLRQANGKMARSGIFVSTGALGVSFGTIFGKSGSPSILLPFALIIISGSLLLLFVKYAEPDGRIACRFNIASGLPFAAVICFAFFSIVIRSFGGSIIPAEWKTGTFLSLLPGFGAFFGKASGGMLGDRFGAKTAGVSALILSIPFLLAGKNIAFLSVAGIILFNITMPITLCTVASKFPANPGLAFGLTTLALLCGNVPTYFFSVPSGAVFLVLTAFVLLSAVFTFLSANNIKGMNVHEKIKQEVSSHFA